MVVHKNLYEFKRIMIMSLLLVEELLDRCSILQSFATSGKYDDYFIDKFDLSPIMKRGPLKWLYLRMNAYPFARRLFVREIRCILSNIRRHYNNYFLSTAKSDLRAEKAIKMIDNYLDKLPKEKTKKNYLKAVLSYMSPFVAGISISQIITASNVIYQYLPLVLLLGIFSFFTALPIFSNKLTGYVLEKHWLGVCLKRTRLRELKEQIIQELMESSNQNPTTYM